MDARPAEQLILESGKSEELRQALSLVQDAQAPDGAPRYGGSVCRALARMIVCRTYAKPLLELVYLVIAAMRVSPDGRYETFFWGLDRATTAGFRGQFASDAKAGDEILSLGGDGVTVNLSDGAFSVTYARMPVLAAFLELLMTVLGYRDLDDAFRVFSKNPATAQKAGDAANSLSRALYSYLKDNLPTAQTQRRNRSFMEYLAEKNGGAMAADAIDDAAILAYWRARAVDGRVNRDAEDTGQGNADGQIDAKTFSGVFLTALRLARTLRAAGDRLAVADARPIGTDREAGEVDPADIEDLLSAVEEGGNLLSPLDEPPMDAIKFLNGRERDGLSDLAYEAGIGQRFPLSVLRNAVFGRGQAKITNALRQGKQGNDLDTVIARAADHNYVDQLEIYRALVAHLERMLLAIYRALLEARRAEASELALLLDSNLDLTALQDAVGITDANEFPDAEGDSDPNETNVVSLAAHRALDQFFAVSDARDGPLAALNERAKAALKGLSRQGFGAGDRADPRIMDGFVHAVRPLRALKHEVATFLDDVSSARDWPEQFAHDRHVFTETFQTLYGQNPDGAHHV